MQDKSTEPDSDTSLRWVMGGKYHAISKPPGYKIAITYHANQGVLYSTFRVDGSVLLGVSVDKTHAKKLAEDDRDTIVGFSAGAG